MACHPPHFRFRFTSLIITTNVIIIIGFPPCYCYCYSKQMRRVLNKLLSTVVALEASFDVIQLKCKLHLNTCIIIIIVVVLMWSVTYIKCNKKISCCIIITCHYNMCMEVCLNSIMFKKKYVMLLNNVFISLHFSLSSLLLLFVIVCVSLKRNLWNNGLTGTIPSSLGSVYSLTDLLVNIYIYKISEEERKSKHMETIIYTCTHNIFFFLLFFFHTTHTNSICHHHHHDCIFFKLLFCIWYIKHILTKTKNVHM